MFLGPNTAVEWPGLDLQLSIDSIVQGRREHVPPSDWRAGLSDRLEQFRRSRRAAPAGRRAS